MDLVVFLQLSEGNEQDYRFATARDINLFCSSDVEAAELLLDLKSANLALVEKWHSCI